MEGGQLHPLSLSAIPVQHQSGGQGKRGGGHNGERGQREDEKGHRGEARLQGFGRRREERNLSLKGLASSSLLQSIHHGKREHLKAKDEEEEEEDGEQRRRAGVYLLK